MEINGCDIIIETEVSVNVKLIKYLLSKHWPDVVFEVDEGADFFAYKNEQAKDIWEGNGLNDNNDADMIYVLFRNDFKQVTFVIDNEKRNKYIVDNIEKFIRNML